MNWLTPFFSLRKWPARLCLFVLGLVALFGFAPFHLWGVTLLTLSLFFAYLWTNKDTDVSAFWMTIWFGLGYFIGHIYWIGVAFIERGAEFIPLMPPMILGLALIKTLIWAMAAWLFQRFAGRGWKSGLSLVCLFMLAELVRGHIFGGLPWNLPGYIFEAGHSFSQFAAIGNIYGLSLLVLILTTSLTSIWVHGAKFKPALAIAIIFVGLFGFGSWRLSDATFDTRNDATLRLVQIPFSQGERMSDGQRNNDIITDFIRASLSPGIEDVTHLVWPEGAAPGLVLEMDNLISVMGGVLSENDNTPPLWMFNTLREEITPDPDGLAKKTYYSSSAAISFDALGIPTVRTINDKHRMVPFGEYIPGWDMFERFGVKVITSNLGSISPTTVKTLADFPGLPKTSAQICYEIVFPGLTPSPEKAEWILNQSSDAWFKSPTGPYQHANIAAYRAIETGLPVVRSASNGISGVIDPYGRYIQKMDIKDAGVLDIRLPIPQRTNQPVRLVTLFIAFLSLIGVFVATRTGRSKSA